MPIEEHAWSGSPSQVLNTGTFVVCGLLSLTVILAIAAIPYAIWHWLVVKNTKYELTTQRLKTHTGVLSKNTEEMELYRVKDLKLEQPWYLRLFGLSNVALISSDTTTPATTIRAVPDAQGLREKIRALVEERRDQKRVRLTEFE